MFLYNVFIWELFAKQFHDVFCLSTINIINAMPQLTLAFTSHPPGLFVLYIRQKMHISKIGLFRKSVSPAIPARNASTGFQYLGCI
jgi:hypothetical protein